MTEVQIDGEIFEIKKITNTINPRYGEYRTGYREIKGARTGTLIIEKTVQKVIRELESISKKKKIYAK